MKVTLIDYTGFGNPDPWHAANVLLFTKSTRLNMSPSLMDDIKAWPKEKKLSELAYMAQTIPSSWEFCSYTFMIEGVSRAFTHQFVRNRHGSYAQQSLRVVNMEEGFDFVMPERFQKTSFTSTQIHRQQIVAHVLATIKTGYRRLVREEEAATEDARSILPINTATNIVAKFNLRTMSELAKSRTGGRTQSEYIQVMDAMCTEVVRVHPWAEQFLFPIGRDYFKEIEEFAERKFGGDLLAKGELLKIVDKLRKGE